jgi:hypothetical protein
VLYFADPKEHDKTFMGGGYVIATHSPAGLDARNWSHVPTVNENGGQMQRTRTEDEGPITTPFYVENVRNGVAVVAGGLKYIKINKEMHKG